MSIPNKMPRITPEEALDVTKIYNVIGLLPSSAPLIDGRPFRAPHLTISNASRRTVDRPIRSKFRTSPFREALFAADPLIGQPLEYSHPDYYS